MSSSIFFLVSQLLCWSCIFELSSGFHSAALTNHLSESCSNIESSHFPSFPWLRLCFFFFVVNPIFFLLLQSLLCRFLRRCLFRKTRRCPDRCVCLSFVHRRQCYPDRQCLFSRWSRLFVSRFFVSSFRLYDELEHFLRCVD